MYAQPTHLSGMECALHDGLAFRMHSCSLGCRWPSCCHLDMRSCLAVGLSGANSLYSAYSATEAVHRLGLAASGQACQQAGQQLS